MLYSQNKINVTEYLFRITGCEYSFAYASQCIWDNLDNVMNAPKKGSFYQLMPDRKDDGFFDWYCYTKPYNQFFKDENVCVLAFVINWYDWVKQGKPQYRDILKQLHENN